MRKISGENVLLRSYVYFSSSRISSRKILSNHRYSEVVFKVEVIFVATTQSPGVGLSRALGCMEDEEADNVVVPLFRGISVRSRISSKDRHLY